MRILSKKNAEITKRLLRLNEKLGAEVVAGFWLEDGDAGEQYANVVYVMPPVAKSENWPMDHLDDLCGVVSDLLEDVVEYTYCWFRTDEQFKKEFPDEIKLRIAS